MLFSHAEKFIAQGPLRKTAMAKMSIVAGVLKEALLFAVTIAQMCSARYLNLHSLIYFFLLLNSICLFFV